jgi:hypothetical protein
MTDLETKLAIVINEKARSNAFFGSSNLEGVDIFIINLYL